MHPGLPKRVVLGLTLLAVCTLCGPAATASPPPGFVSTNGTRLSLDGQPYRPAGINIYNANSNGFCWYSMGGSVLDDSLTALAGSVNVFRAWFFQQLATTGGQRDWTAFGRTLATAKAHGLKVVATLIDQWGNCGSSVSGGYKDETWYESGYTQVDPAGIVSYRNWVQEVVGRYKDDPTILAWQLVNEPEVLLQQGGDCAQVPESEATAELKAFAADVSALIKSIDPNHLVSLGTLGGGQCGTQNDDYEEVLSVPTLDLCEYHDYQPGQAIPGDQWNGLQRRLDQCAELGKPLLVGELGVKPSDVGGSLQDRAEVVASKLCAQFGAGVAGELLWAWNKDGSSPGDYDIGPNDPVLGVLAPWTDPNKGCGPTGIVASAFSAGWSDRAVLLRWRSDGVAVLGFNLYRERRGKLVKLNRVVIPLASAASRPGPAYTWRDRTAPAQKRLVYRLQALAIDGSRSWVGAATSSLGP